MAIKNILRKYYAEILVILVGIILGYFLMFSTFEVENNKLLIATKAWSDFASHIPLIRSFSLGNNFPPQYPLFPGEPIKYHFIFYALVGLLEKAGIRIDIALNSLSILGFTLLVLVIYLISKELFKSKSIGLISIAFFIFNSSLSFIYFFDKFPLSTNTIKQIVSNHDFLSFAPYGSGIISAFWNLNIYTNQRHLALAFALSLSVILVFIKKINGSLNIKNEKLLFLSIGLIFGILFFFHIAVFLMTAIVIFLLAVLFKKIRKNALLLLIPAALIAFPQYKYLTSSIGYHIHFVFGYLVSENLSAANFFQFWIYNLGLSLFLIPLGLLTTKNIQRKIFIPFFILFIIGNAVQFSPEIAANHKFFNYFIIFGNIYSAFFIYMLWVNKNIILKTISISLFLFMTLGGIIDLFPIFNDNKVEISDYKIDQRALWIKNNTNPNSIFLNSEFLYDPASLAGRKIYLGWPYFAWSQGYNTDKRFSQLSDILGSREKNTACELLESNNIDYVEIQSTPDSNFPPNSQVFSKYFKPVYKDINNNYSIYNVKGSCQ